MSSTDRQAPFRGRKPSRRTTNELKQQGRERSQQLGIPRPTGRVDHGPPGDPAGPAVWTGVDRRPGGTNPTKHSVTFAADLTSSQTVASRSREANRPPLPQTITSPFAMPIHHDRDMDRRPAEVKVTSHSPEQEELISSQSHHYMPPLLGYDWIAGVLDTESYLTERSEEFFDDLRAFRAMNKDECVSSQPVRLLEERPPAQRLVTERDNPDSSMDTHQCTFCYRINSRLFPVPLDPPERCPVCRRHKSTIPHTASQPALVRVSIPRSTLGPAYQYKAHRRRSFDPSDSLGLPSHCLSGWANTGQTAVPEADHLDLRSSLNGNKATDLFSQAPMDSSLSGGHGDRRGHQTAAVSRLARFRFQHLSPKRKHMGTHPSTCTDPVTPWSDSYL
ncbi:hypothetical protein NHX12_030662 [Muraenolepis orangiensis]|uniref:Migration and invasion inhibitory protein n=1 Tax=Muraenolepis orangiensis TaxID=630683 RepID=A0A9Q0E858_9TELE|nr:hypothetical protein NHX12_030662 [Muraenolepis orangiensis]